MAASTSSLSSVVSKLTRASLGLSAPSSVKDEDLDRYVADLIMSEAKQSEERYKGKDGIRAYLPNAQLPEANIPKTNKRFLHSIIRNVDDHNTAILREQAKAAEEIRLQREEEERAERRARAVEAAQERMRRLMGGGRRRSRDRRDTAESSSSSSRRRRSGSRERSDWRYREGSDDEGRYRNRDRDYDSSRHKDRERSTRPSRTVRRKDDSEVLDSRERDSRRTRVSPTRSASPLHLREQRDAGRHSRHSSPRPNKPVEETEHASARTSILPEDDTTSTSSPSRAPSRRRHQESSGERGRSRTVSPIPSIDRRKRSRLRSNSPDVRERSRSRSRSASPERSSSRRKHARKPHRSSRHDDDDNRDSQQRSKHQHRSEKEGKRERKRRRHHDDVADDAQPESVSRPGHSSKMDKYFDPAYDPALDYTPVLDTNTLVQDGAFDSWNTMLQLIRIRREDKEEKKLREKGGDPSPSSSKNAEPGLMELVYKKRGAVREWDLGKD